MVNREGGLYAISRLQGKAMLKNFGQELSKKRKEAQLSITELAQLSGLSEASLEAMEQGAGELPTFDICYRLGQVISSHSHQLFVLQDLWQALKADKLEIS
ncbi:MAG: helix-turn-helix domain-containing protein [Blastocatellia bacterium]|nr:helix-turn-helix domain-containing protein [Blastocatellia bacterium]